MENDLLALLLFTAGLAHVVLCFGSLLVPRALKWKESLMNVRPLIRQLFWTYAAYIIVINFSFGVISLIATDELLNGSMLAKSITLFISLYWFARIGIQFLYFDKTDAPKGAIYTVGEIALILLFVFFTIVYFMTFLHNNSWM